jgi:uncharacterized protein (DUF1919 family)
MPSNPIASLPLKPLRLLGSLQAARFGTGSVQRVLLRARLRDQNFTIVSNNCWGGHIYQLLGKPYQTPFIGLFFAPNCYLTLISRLRWYLSQPVRFTRRSRHDNINELREQQGSLYPIGYLGDDIEVQFMHYKSEAEAAEKWARRVERVCRDDDRLFFKFCDRDGCTQDQLAAFDSAPIAHKVCFVSRPSPQLRHAVLIPSEHDSQVPDGLSLSCISPRYFDTAGWIMGSNGRPRWWQPVRCI